MNKIQLTFIGHISNRKALFEQLNLNDDASLHQIINSAYDKWTVTFNQNVSGDYALILPIKDSDEVFICLSAFCSYQIFYLFKQDQLQLSTSAKFFRQNAKISPLAIACLLETDVIVPPLSMFTEVSQLSCGESQLWHVAEQSRLLSKHSLTLQQKLEVQSNEDIAAQTSLANAPQSYDFNELPKLCRQLCQPVSQPWLVTYAAKIANTKEKNLISDAGPDFLGTVTLPSFVDKILAPLRKRCRREITLVQKQWHEQYEKEIADWTANSPKPDFSHWFALTYGLPAKWSQMRLIAESADKTIMFSYTEPKMAASLLNKESQDTRYQPLFGFDSSSIRNPYDAVGRLMWHGNENVTHKLFKLVPPFTAGLIKRHSEYPEQVDSFCFHSLTLDHLSRQYQWSLTD